MVFVPLHDASDIHKCNSDQRESSSSLLLEQYTSSDKAPKLRPQDPVDRAGQSWLSYEHQVERATCLPHKTPHHTSQLKKEWRIINVHVQECFIIFFSSVGVDQYHCKVDEVGSRAGNRVALNQLRKRWLGQVPSALKTLLTCNAWEFVVFKLHKIS